MRTSRSATQSSSVSRPQTRSGAISAWLVGSALIALALVCLPIGSGPSSASVMATSGTISNSALKGDRLSVHRVGAAPKSEVSKPGTIPVGCEAAFSKLVRIGNFSSRCLT